MINALYMSLVDQIDLDEQNRQVQIRRAWEAYHGRLPKALKVKPGQLDDNVYLNFCRVVVDKGVSFLFGQDVAFEADELAETEAETWLEAVWQANRKMSFLQKLALNGGVCGQAFVKILLRPGGLPRLVLLDPETVSVRYAADDFEDVLGYVIRYPSKDPQTGKPVFIRQRIEKDGVRWTIVDERGDAQSLNWQVVGETIWPYAFAPVVDGQNLPVPNEYWGASDLEADLIQLQLNINFIMSNLARIIRYHAHPKTWGRGFSAKELNIAVDETIVLPHEHAELRNLEMQSDLASSIELYKRLREALHEISRIPEVATGRVETSGNLSGVALQVLYQPLLEKTETKRRTYGDLLVELNRRLLAIGGHGNEVYTTLHWPELVPSDPLQERQAALLDQQLGVSQDTTLGRLGFDPDLERQKRELGEAELGDKLLSGFDKGL